MDAFLRLCQQEIGINYVLTEEADTLVYRCDQRQRATGKALAVVRPGSTEEVAAIVRLCQQYRVPIVPQGGNTGLVLGSIPDESGTAIVLSLTRLNRIRGIDCDNHTITVEAGCLLASVQNAAAQHALLFPLSLASEGSCTIGGNLATNAGGTAVLRYGNARELCLGLEVVTPQGEIWHGLRGLRKDNTGYDLRDLYIGAEGTLGIITAATLKLFPQARSTSAAWLAVDNITQAVALLTLSKQVAHATLSGFEIMNALSLCWVHQHFPHYQRILPQESPYFVLIELSGSASQEDNDEQLGQLTALALESELATDAAIATSLAQVQHFWTLRESISAAQAKQGKNIKHDISLPISQLAQFVASTDALLHNYAPNCQMVTFGHVGDGNLHYNVAAPNGIRPDDFLDQQEAINRIVHDQVQFFHGSISAEHGIGALKKEELRRAKSAVELSIMNSIKRSLDPDNLMNPGKIL